MLTEALKNHLTQDILPFWLHLADRDKGGWHGYVGMNLQVDKDYFKGCILHSRILWTFSTAARLLGNPEYFEAAKHALRFMEKFADHEHGGVFWSVTPDGVPLDTTKHTYCQAFAVYGLSAYARATGDKAALDRAMELFEIIEGPCSDEGGYGEAFNADFTPAGNEKLSDNPKLMERGETAARTMNTLLHVLEAYAELYRAGKDERVRKAGAKCLERFLHVMYSPAQRRLEVFYDKDYRSLLDMQSYGHDIEGSWLIWDAVEAMIPEAEQAPYRAMCINLADAVHARAFTDAGVDNEIVEGEVENTRVWWVQGESLLGFDNAWRLTGEEKFAKAAEHQWEVLKRFIIDPREGSEWFGYATIEGKPIAKPIVDEWKCPYHNGRMCLRMIEKE